MTRGGWPWSAIWLLACLRSACGGTAAASPVSFQVHSYNDLRLFPQALAKVRTGHARATHGPRVIPRSSSCRPSCHAEPSAPVLSAAPRCSPPELRTELAHRSYHMAAAKQLHALATHNVAQRCAPPPHCSAPSHASQGATWFKVDPHWMPTEFCRNQPQDVSPISAAFAVRPGNASGSGCFVLSHDRPTASRRYNTTGQLLDLLADPSHARWFRNPASRVHIALCFKWDGALGVCGLTQDAGRWRDAADAFFVEALARIQTHALNVELVLDGVATPTHRPCLRHRWPPWNATWIIGQDPADAMFSDAPADGYDSFQVNNMPVGSPAGSHLIDEQKDGYGKFANRSYPFLLYEPADQASIVRVVDAYGSGRPLHPAGFRFAINIDPVQLQVYAAAAVTANGSQALTGAAQSILPVVDHGNSRPFLADRYLLLATVDGTGRREGTNDKASNRSLRYINLDAPHRVCVLEGAGDGTGVTGWARADAEAGNVYVISHANGSVSWFNEDPTAGAGNSSADTQCPLAQGAGAQLDVAVASSVGAWYGPNGTLMLVQAYLSPEGGANATEVCFRAWTGLKPGVRSCAALLTPAGGGVAPTPKTVHISATEVAELPHTCGGGEGAVALAVIGTAERQVYRMELCLTPDGSLQEMRDTPAFTAVGTNPQCYLRAVSATGNVGNTVADTTVLAAMVQGDSYCWNSEKHNKQPAPATCDATPNSTRDVLSYTVATWDGLLRAAPDKPISSCTWPSVAHGAYDQGSSPTVTIRDDGQVVASHVPPVDTSTPDPETQACGSCIPGRGDRGAAVVIDQWGLPSF